MINYLPPQTYNIFKDTGRLPVILHILTSESDVKIKNLINVFREFNITISEVLDTIQ